MPQIITHLSTTKAVALNEEDKYIIVHLLPNGTIVQSGTASFPTLDNALEYARRLKIF